MSERRDDIPEPSKRKASEVNLTDAFGEFSLSKKPRPDGDPPPPDEAPHENRPRAMPRLSYLLLAPEEGHNVPRTLKEQEANPVNPILLLNDSFEARVVLDCTRFVGRSMMFRVFDVHNTRYEMQLLKSGQGQFFFNPGWTRFVNDHNLGAGDEISFNKNLDTTISDDFYYILKYVKKHESSIKPGDGAESSRKPDDGAESSRKPDDDASSSRKPGDGAESSRKPGGGPESCRNPGDDSVESVFGIRMPEFKIIYHRSLMETPPDQEQNISRMPLPGSSFRPFQLEAICLSKTITATEILQSCLYLDVYDAIILSDNPRVAETPPDISMGFMVFDRKNWQYTLTLRHFEMPGGIIGFHLDGLDKFFGRNHDMKRGDRVAFYKFLDRRVHYGYYYFVLNLPADVDCQNRSNPFRPGSRELLPESLCFSKILSQDDVSPGNAAGLQLEALQARHFESSSRSLNEAFMVFDGDDRQYDMKLSYYFNSERKLVCFLDNQVGWHSFVSSNNLRDGDTIHVNKTLDQSVYADHYFVITFTRAVFHGQLGMEF